MLLEWIYITRSIQDWSRLFFRSKLAQKCIVYSSAGRWPTFTPPSQEYDHKAQFTSCHAVIVSFEEADLTTSKNDLWSYSPLGGAEISSGLLANATYTLLSHNHWMSRRSYLADKTPGYLWFGTHPAFISLGLDGEHKSKLSTDGRKSNCCEFLY